MNRSLLALCFASCVAFADIDTGAIGQNNSASNGFSNAAVAGQTNTQVNLNSQSSAKYGGGVECPQSTLTVAPYGSQTHMGGATGQTVGVAVGVAIPLGDGGTCMKIADSIARDKERNSRYDQIKLCIELKKNGVRIDAFVDPELYNTCKGVHL